MLYNTIATLSGLIRFFCISNPFEAMTYPILFNIIAAPLLHTLTYNIVGLYYRKNSNPVIGSIMYLVFYWLHVLILSFVVENWLNKFIIIASLFAYIGILILIHKVRQRFLAFRVL